MPGEAEPVHPDIWHSHVSQVLRGGGPVRRDGMACVRSSCCVLPPDWVSLWLSWRCYHPWQRVLGDESGAVTEASVGSGGPRPHRGWPPCNIFTRGLFVGQEGMGAVTCTQVSEAKTPLTGSAHWLLLGLWNLTEEGRPTGFHTGDVICQGLARPWISF